MRFRSGAHVRKCMPKNGSLLSLCDGFFFAHTKWNPLPQTLHDRIGNILNNEREMLALVTIEGK